MIYLATTLITFSFIGLVSAYADQPKPEIKITKARSQAPTKGSADNFTGQVKIEPIFQPNEPSRTSGAMVTFEPGARTAWHTHPQCGMKTDFFTRSFDMGRHEAYDDLVNRVMSVFTDPTQALKYSTPAQIAEVVYEAATDGKNQLRYIAGEDAKESYALRKQLGDEAFLKTLEQQFFGSL